MKPGDPVSATRHRQQVLSLLRPWRATSRLEIAAGTGLSPATVSRIAGTLVRGNILTETVKRQAVAGRPVRGLEVNGACGAVLGLSLLPPQAHLLVLNLRGEVLEQSSVDLHTDRGPAGILDPLRKGVAAVLQQWPKERPGLAQVGVALPGQWSRDRGISHQYPRVPEWRDVDVRSLVEEWAGAPATVVGYAQAMAFAEHARRAAEAPRNLVAVEVGEHIAMGAVVNAGMLEGSSGSAGELGHITIGSSGAVCYCGNRGCLEMLATCNAVEDEVRTSESARQALPARGGTRFEDVVKLAEGGDSFAARLLARVSKTLGVGLAAAVNLFNPELLVLGGRFFGAGDLVFGPLGASLKEHALPRNTKQLTIERSTLGTSAGALGAGALAIEQVVRRL